MFLALRALMHPSSQHKHGRSMALRSGQGLLSCPSSLQGHSDFPTPITSLLPVSPNLRAAYRVRNFAETLGPQALPPLSFTACHWPYPGSPAGARTLCFPADAGLLPSKRGSARIPTYAGFIPHPDSPSYYRPELNYEAAPFSLCCGLRLWLAPLTG
jgi:hypothetical protein